MKLQFLVSNRYDLVCYTSNTSLAIITVENAAAAKVFFECHYNTATSNELTPRSLRRRQFEGALYRDPTLTPVEKDEKRRAWARKESDHLRETRVMKSRASKAMKGKDITSSRYELVQVLGKGSFGVVRLVREKVDKEYGLTVSLSYSPQLTYSQFYFQP